MIRRAFNLTSLTAIGALLLAGSSLAPALAWEVTEEQVREAVLNHVEEKLSTRLSKDGGEQVDIHIVKVPAAPYNFPEAIAAEEIKLDVNSPLGEMYSNRAVVRVKMTGPNGRTRDIGVPVKISIKKPVWVVKETIDAQGPLAMSALALETREISRQFDYTVGKEKDLSKYIARVNLRQGEMLDARKLMIPPDVRGNSEVRVILTDGDGLKIAIHAIAMADGHVGDTIKVKQMLFGVKKTYTGKIIDRNKVLVEI